MAGDAKGSGSNTSPITQILERLGMSRDDLTRHTEQMRSFLQTQEVKDLTSNSIGALVSNAALASTTHALVSDTKGGSNGDSSVTCAAESLAATATPTRASQAVALFALNTLITAQPDASSSNVNLPSSSPPPLPFFPSSSPFQTPLREPLAVSSPVLCPSSPPSTSPEKPLPYRLPPGPYPAYKPPFSYAALIGQAILASPDHRLTLGDIYKYITTVYPFFQKGQIAWQNSVRHNLSLNPCFTKIDKNGLPVERSLKGSLWAISDEYTHCFNGGNFKKPPGLSYLGSKRRATDDNARSQHKKQKSTHPNTFQQMPTPKQPLSWRESRAHNFPICPSYPASSSAASSSASSPPPSIAASSSSSSVPELTNSSSSPPDGESEEETALGPGFNLTTHDVFLSEPIKLAPTPRRPSSPTKPSFLFKGGDLLSRVIEARSILPPSSIDDNAPQLSPGPSYPQSHLRTPTRPRKDEGPRRSLTHSDGKMRLPPTPVSGSRAPIPITPPLGNKLPHSPERTPVSHKGLTMGPSHPALLNDQTNIGSSTQHRQRIRDTFEENTPQTFSKEGDNWIAGAKTGAKTHLPFASAQVDVSASSSALIKGKWKADPSTPPRQPDGPSDDECERTTPRKQNFSNLSTAPFTPRRLLFGNSSGNDGSTSTAKFSPSLFRTPVQSRELQPLLYDPYDTPAYLADELHRLENPETTYGDSPGSFFGRKTGLLYQSPYLSPHRATRLKYWASHEDPDYS